MIRSHRMRWIILLGMAILFWPATPGSRAQTLTIGVQIETASVDPHFSLSNPAVSTARHMFDTLVHPDDRQRLHPGLALSWTPAGRTEWEFRLRPGVRFHDGRAFTAADVAFSLARARDTATMISGFSALTRQITAIQIVDPLTIRLGTDQPFPLMAEYLSAVPIVSRAAAESASTADFNSGKAAVGTGPFRFVGWTRGDKLQLARNDAYWAAAPVWENVIIRPIPDDGARVAAMLSGTVDMIDLLPAATVSTLRAKPDIALAQTVSNRVIFLAMNFAPGPNPAITDSTGVRLPVNPLTDRRVRLALSKAINRDSLVSQVMEGLGVPASQMLPDGYPGTSLQLRPQPHDLAGAKVLLAEAGFPNGFAITMLVPRDRNASDVKLAEALGQMFTQIGVRVALEVLPYAIAQPRFKRGEFAVALRGWGTETGEGSMALRAILATVDPARGIGMVNGGAYSNPQLDALLTQALATLDPAQREPLVARATEIGIGDVGIIPLQYQIAIWALRAGLSYQARSDNYTFAFDVHRVAKP